MLAYLMLMVACSGDNTEDSGVAAREFSDCDPLSYDYCSVPFPSMFYMREDTNSPTGYRIDLREKTIPFTSQGQISYQPKADFWNERDGFSPLAPLLVEFPDATVDGLPGHETIADSLTETSPILVVDADTGERMPMWAELDMSDPLATKRMMLIYPALPLRNGHHYVAALRNVKNTSGQVIPASEGYAHLRDGTATDNWDIEGRRESYKKIFAAVEGAGWDVADTQLAWDFVIASAHGITGKAEWIRDDAFAFTQEKEMAYTVDYVEDDYNENIARLIRGHFDVPVYTETDVSGSVLARDESGNPYRTGTASRPFTLLIPRTAVDNPRPMPIMQYGHGLLGGQDEVQSGYLGEMANRYGFVIFAVDWTGMKAEDSNPITEMILTQIDQFAMIPERSQQGFGEFFVAERLMTGPMVNDEHVAFPDESGQMVSVMDPKALYYYGNSQGAILGGAYMTLQTEIPRGVLGVGGGPYALLLYRSADFAPFFAVFKAVYQDSRDIAFWMDLMQILWDSGEAGGMGRQMSEEPLEGAPAHQILLQDAIGDCQVTTLGAANLARAYGAPLIEPAVRPVWGLETKASGYTGSAFVEFDHGMPEVPATNVPPNKSYDTHEDTRRVLEGQDQLWHFLTTGEVVNYCDGACDPH